MLRSVDNNKARFLAHRAVHQTYSKNNLGKFGCTADRVIKTDHSFIENTLDSISEAFSYGAEIVEIDIHPTTDGQFAVFHDWTLECRTNGEGDTRSHSMAYLKSLDISYNYTFDSGKTYPFRSKGIGKMPSLTEVLDTFPNQKFLINFKSGDPNEGMLVNQFLSNRNEDDVSRLWFYGGTEPTTKLLSIRPELKGFTKPSVKRCAIQYSLISWTGYIPKSCRNTLLAIPKDYAAYFWGWPNVLVDRMKSVNSDVILFDFEDGHTDGIDDPKEIQTFTKRYRGLIWTDKIEQVGHKK